METDVVVLVLAPHPDDEAIGCGGAIRLHAASGDRVVTVFLTSGELGLKHLPEAQAWSIRESEATAAAGHLGSVAPHFLRLPDWQMGDDVPAAAAKLRPLLESERPGIVYLPHPDDDHPDHRATLPVLREALSMIPGPAPEVRAYEVWSPMSRWDLAEDITTVMPAKLAAIGCYASQLAQFPYGRAATGLAQYRGALAGRCEFAEVFRVLPVETVMDH